MIRVADLSTFWNVKKKVNKIEQRMHKTVPQHKYIKTHKPRFAIPYTKSLYVTRITEGAHHPYHCELETEPQIFLIGTWVGPMAMDLFFLHTHQTSTSIQCMTSYT